MTKRIATSVDVWLSPGCDTEYSISLCDDDGEIECLGGDDDADEAFEQAYSLADEYGLPAQLIPYESGEVTRSYEPAVVDAELAQ